MRILDTRDYLDQVCDLLADGNTALPVPVAGSSMCPFLRDGDTVYLDPLTAPARRGDIVLFTRPGGQYVLHRVAKQLENGLYLIIGDNQRLPEIVSEAQICAIVTSACRRGRHITPRTPVWRFYAGFWLKIIPYRQKIAALRQRFR